MEVEGIESHYTRISMLGRNDIQLGDLYNYRNDRVVKGKICNQIKYNPKILFHESFILGNQLEGKCWPNRKIEEYLLEFNHSKSYNKLEHMNLDEHSQASVVGDLIGEYCGSSLYLNERWKVTEATGTLICRLQTGKIFLDMSTLVQNEAQAHFPSDEKEFKKSSEATHVVVGLVYGFESYCVIAKDLDDDEEETRKEEEEKLSELAAQFVDGLKDNVDPDDFRQQFDKEEIHQFNQIKCRLYADNQNRCQRKYGVFDVYQMWSKLLAGQTDDFTIAAIVCPIRVIVDPFNSFPDQLFDYYYDTESKLIAQCYFHLFEVRRILSRMNANRFVSNQKTNRQSLRQFRVAVRKYQELMKKSIKHAILEARHTIDDDDGIVRIIDICNTHPVFRPSQLKRWLSDKQVEWEMTEKMANLSGISFLPGRKHLKKALADTFDKKFSLVLNIPPLDEKTNERLEAMLDYVEASVKLVAVADEEQMMAYHNIPCWYMVEPKRKLVVDEIRRMADYVRRNHDDKSQVQFFITPAGDSGDAGQDFRWHYSVYESENLLSDKLSQLPGPPTNVHYQTLSSSTAGNNRVCPTSISGLLRWDYQDLTGIPYHFVVQYRLKDSFWTDCWLQKTAKAGESQMAVNLFYDRSRVAEFRVAADTCIGRGEFSEIVESQILHEPGGHFEMSEETKPEMSDEEPLLPAMMNNDNTIPNGHTSVVSLLSLLGLVQTDSEQERKSEAVSHQPDTEQAPAEEINNPSVIDKDTEIGNESDQVLLSAHQFKSRNYVNIIEEYYDPDEDSDNGFEHYTV